MTDFNPETLSRAVLGIDTWLETMRAAHGYTGPVAHRWQDCLIYAGPGYDWRYEGIILGYLRLHQASGEPRWLEKACRAGRDLLAAQLPDGRYRASSFETNPSPGGTPHEAACDLALLRLAAHLKTTGDPTWEGFYTAARRNLTGFYLQCLWDPARRSFFNLAGDPALVPNKICTLVEAGFALAALDGEDSLLAEYFLPSLASILPAQVKHGGHLHGAIDQSISGGHPRGRYFPYYTARCIPALLAAFQYGGQQVYLDAASEAMGFILRSRLADGSFPQACYANGRQTAEPRWIAACGDILRAAGLLRDCGVVQPALDQTEAWLLAGVLPSGGIRTASGFADLESFRHPQAPDFRDLLPVCGWVDKAFHALALALPAGWRPGLCETGEVVLECLYRGQAAVFHETSEKIEVTRGKQVLYSWRKGETWASTF